MLSFIMAPNCSLSNKSFSEPVRDVRKPLIVITATPHVANCPRSNTHRNRSTPPTSRGGIASRERAGIRPVPYSRLSSKKPHSTAKPMHRSRQSAALLKLSFVYGFITLRQPNKDNQLRVEISSISAMARMIKATAMDNRPMRLTNNVDGSSAEIIAAINMLPMNVNDAAIPKNKAPRKVSSSTMSISIHRTTKVPAPITTEVTKETTTVATDITVWDTPTDRINSLCPLSSGMR